MRNSDGAFASLRDQMWRNTIFERAIRNLALSKFDRSLRLNEVWARPARRKKGAKKLLDILYGVIHSMHDTLCKARCSYEPRTIREPPAGTPSRLRGPGRSRRPCAGSNTATPCAKPSPITVWRSMKARFTRLLRRLESQGLLNSQWREEDKRRKRFYLLSSEGARVLEQLLAEWAKHRSFSRRSPKGARPWK